VRGKGEKIRPQEVFAQYKTRSGKRRGEKEKRRMGTLDLAIVPVLFAGKGKEERNGCESVLSYLFLLLNFQKGGGEGKGKKEEDVEKLLFFPSRVVLRAEVREGEGR